MTSKRQRRLAKKRARQKPDGIPDLAETKATGQPRTNGRFGRPDEDPRKTALKRRCVEMNIDPTRQAMRDASAPHRGSEIGMCIEDMAGSSDRASKLWGTWQGYCAAMRSYRMRYIGQSGSPKGAAITMVPEPMQTDQSAKVDLRSTEERDRDAISGYMRWHGYLGMMADKDAASLLVRIEANRVGQSVGTPLWDRRPTVIGYRAYDALCALHDIVDGRG